MRRRPCVARACGRQSPLLAFVVVTAVRCVALCCDVPTTFGAPPRAAGLYEPPVMSVRLPGHGYIGYIGCEWGRSCIRRNRCNRVLVGTPAVVIVEQAVDVAFPCVEKLCA